jgi:hypothetical protein
VSTVHWVFGAAQKSSIASYLLLEAMLPPVPPLAVISVEPNELAPHCPQQFPHFPSPQRRSQQLESYRFAQPSRTPPHTLQRHLPIQRSLSPMHCQEHPLLLHHHLRNAPIIIGDRNRACPIDPLVDDILLCHSAQNPGKTIPVDLAHRS